MSEASSSAFLTTIDAVLSAVIATVVFVWTGPALWRQVRDDCGSAAVATFVVWLVAPSVWWRIVVRCVRA